MKDEMIVDSGIIDDDTKADTKVDDDIKPKTEPQGHNWEFVAYPDSETYDMPKLMERIYDTFDEVAYCLHDKDIKLDDAGQPVLDANGVVELKKAHYHIVCKRKSSPLRLPTLTKKFPEFFYGATLIKASSFRSRVRYLIHADELNPYKYKYDISAIQANFNVNELINDISEPARLGMIYEYITSSGCESVDCLFRWSLAHGCASEVRRGWTMWKDIIRERKGKEVI